MEVSSTHTETVSSVRPAVGRAGTLLSSIGDYVGLTKPGIVVWLLLTGFAGMVVAKGGLPGLWQTVAALGGLALSCGGANAVNMWYDRDIDAVMRRTVGRPIPTGRLQPVQALAFGILAGVASVLILWVFVNPQAAMWSASGYLYYVFIYTFWLKRRTPQNIVIGGAAGAFPPLVGWAAATGHASLAAFVMFMIIFLWTPPHFWALALYKQEDYRRAGIPMMPVVRGDLATKRQSLAYSVLLLAASILLWRIGAVGTLYLVVAMVLGLGFIGLNVALLFERSAEMRLARKTFRYSLLYVLLLFSAMMVSLPTR